MRFDDEIIRAVKRQASLDDTQPRKTDDELTVITETVRSAVSSGTYDFTTSTSQVLTQSGGKKRYIKKYADCYSAESVLCQCIKQILDRTFRIRYPNRNKSVHSVFDTLKAVKQMADFTIIKCDFKDYFNSVSAQYVFEKYIRAKLSNRFETDLIEKFTKQTRFAYAGFSTSNVIAEIIAEQFDSAVRLAFADKGILFFERYIDDTLIIINEHIEEAECHRILNDILKSVYHDESIKSKPKCKTRFNHAKFIHVTHRGLMAIPNTVKLVDYLGYEFRFIHNPNAKKHQDIVLTYGITEAKRKKYKKRLENLIALFTEERIDGVANPDYQNLELLRHRIAAFTSREVYQSRRFRQTVWKTKGFIGNYGELRYLLETDLIDGTTKNFLKDLVTNAFNNAGFTTLPYFMVGSLGKSGYNLFENMKKNKTFLFVERIGYSEQALKKLCSQVGISLTDINGKNRGYGNLARDYLIKVKVGY